MLHGVTREGGRRVSLTILNHLRVQRERSEVTLLMRSLARRTEQPFAFMFCLPNLFKTNAEKLERLFQVGQ